MEGTAADAAVLALAAIFDGLDCDACALGSGGRSSRSESEAGSGESSEDQEPRSVLESLSPRKNGRGGERGEDDRRFEAGRDVPCIAREGGWVDVKRVSSSLLFRLQE